MLENAMIKIKINTKTVTVKTNKQGTYTYKTKANKIGTNNITITYPGNQSYKKSTIKQTYKTIPRPTKLTINKINTTKKGKQVTITGKLTDNKNKIIKNANLKIKINTKTVTVKTNKQGIYKYTFKTTKKGKNPITVTYNSNKNYKTSTIKRTIIVN
ncbi:hypothetical protein PXD04_06860 [Methanosphaera sp. ISO3-F5]